MASFQIAFLNQNVSKKKAHKPYFYSRADLTKLQGFDLKIPPYVFTICPDILRSVEKCALLHKKDSHFPTVGIV